MTGVIIEQKEEVNMNGDNAISHVVDLGQTEEKIRTYGISTARIEELESKLLNTTNAIDYEKEYKVLKKENYTLKAKLKKAEWEIEKMRIAVVNILIKLGKE